MSSILYINLSRYVIDVYGFYHYLSFVTSRTSSDSSYFRHVVPFDSIGRSLRARNSSNLSICLLALRGKISRSTTVILLLEPSG